MNQDVSGSLQVERSPCIEEKLTARIDRGGLGLIDEHTSKWETLCSKSSRNEPFYRPEWIASYLEAFEPCASLRLVSAWRGKHLKGVLPLREQEASFCGLTVRRLIGCANVHSGRFDIVRENGPDGEGAIREMWKSLRDGRDWDVIEIPDVPAGGSTETMLELAERDGFLTGRWATIQSPFVQIGEASDGRLFGRSSRFRRNVRRRWRLAEEQWPVRVLHGRTADPKTLRRFYELEKSGWKGSSKTAIDCNVATRQFYDRIATVAGRLGYLSVYLLEFGDSVVAGHFGLTYGDCYYCPKVAYSESYATYGPGHLMVDHILRDCVERGLRRFDFLGPWMEWKGDWTDQVLPHSHCYVFSPTSLGRTLHASRFRLMTGLRRVARHPVVAGLRRGGRR